MTLKKCLLILSVLVYCVGGFSQVNTSLKVSNDVFISSSANLPFWMWANRDGKIDKENTFLNLSEFSGSGKLLFNDSKSYLQAGTTLLAGLGNKNSYLQANQLFARLNIKNWELNAGLYYNEEQFGGLSTTNGNIAQSRNARPHPRIGIRLADYKPIPWIGKYIEFKGEYEEGWLNDKRFVMGTHLHHKSLYFRLKPFENFDIQAGLEHFVMWGGISSDENIGQLPDNCSAYYHYISWKKWR